MMGSEGLYAYDMDGRLIWKQDLGKLDQGAAALLELRHSGATTLAQDEASSVVFGLFTVILTWIVAFLVDLGFLLWIGCAEGEVGDNRFGPPPAAG